MIRPLARLALVALALGVLPLAGCSSKSTGQGQPKLQGPPDPKVKGPALPGPNSGSPGKAAKLPGQ